MAAGTTRPREEGAVGEFLDAASVVPSALLIEGEPSIGKTTLWSEAVQHARALKFQVLSARATSVESASAYTAFTELLAEIEPAVWTDLPEPQRAAVDQILSRARVPGAATDHRAGGALRNAAHRGQRW